VLDLVELYRFHHL